MKKDSKNKVQLNVQKMIEKLLKFVNPLLKKLKIMTILMNKKMFKRMIKLNKNPKNKVKIMNVNLK